MNNIGFLFNNNADWHIVSQEGIFPLHPKDAADPMMCLRHNDLVRYQHIDFDVQHKKPYAKITTFIKK